jgi:hypothetical protein
MRKYLLLAIALAIALLTAACQGHTTGATNVKATTAKLTGVGHCDTGDAGWLFFEYRESGTTPWTRGDLTPVLADGADAGTDPDPCPSRLPASGDSPLSDDVAGLKPGTTYQFRVGFKFTNGSEVFTDSSGSNGGTSYETFTTHLFAPGVVTTADNQKSCRAAQSLGAEHIRVEFDIATEPGTAMNNLMDYCNDRGVRVLLLAGFEGRTPTQAEAENLADWADTYGPGGSFYTSRSDGHLAVQQIEFGNETSYCYQYGHNVGSGPCQGAWYNAASYATLAQTYATRAEQAAAAIAPKDVDLLVQADNGGVGNQWVHNMFVSQPDLDDSVGGWSVHPYGPEAAFEAKIDALISHTNAEGASTAIPIDVTEYGLASDCPADPCDSWPSSPGNFGFPLDPTYAEAGTLLTDSVNLMKSDYASRLRDLMIYQAHDNQAHNANNNRESFMGCLLVDETNKGAYSTACRNILGGNPAAAAPVVAPSSGSTPATLHVGSPTGQRLRLKGVNVWGLQDSITTTFGASQYTNRAAVADTIKGWDANVVRFRVLADDYNSAPSSATGNLTKAQIIQRIKDWRDEVVGRGMYFMPTSWDALDGTFDDADWAGNGFRVHQMFADIHAALGDDPMVIYEVTNEPNNVTWAQWDANMRASILYFRETIGYKGPLVIDPIWWANSGTGGQGYDDTWYSGLETYDAARAGMGGKHQLVFAKHDYAPQYTGKVWNGTSWASGAGGSQIKHLIFESEFGNYNGDPSTVSDTWSAAAASFFAGRFASQENYAGAVAFLFGPWFDANAMTCQSGQTPPNCGTDNATPTTWGTSVRDAFLGG